MKRLEYTTESGFSTRIAPPLMQDAGEARMHMSLLKISVVAVLVLLLVCSGAAAGGGSTDTYVEVDSWNGLVSAVSEWGEHRYHAYCCCDAVCFQ